MFVKSIIQKASKLTKEIVIVYNKISKFKKEEEIKGINVKSVGTYEEQSPEILSPQGLQKLCTIRSVATHQGISECVNPYIIISDDDVIFFKKHFDEMYLKFHQKYNFNIIGVSHPRHDNQAYGIFPSVINCLVKKTDLPDREFLKDDLFIRKYLRAFKTNEGQNPPPFPCNGMYLTGAPPLSRYAEFPKPGKLFDIGCNLWLWDKDKKSRSLTFLSQDEHKYNTNCFVSTIDEFDEYIKDETLLMHAQCYSKNNIGAEDKMKEWLKLNGKKIY